MVFTCGEEIENITGFFVKHFVINEDYINYYSFTGMFQLVSRSFRPNISLNLQ